MSSRTSLVERPLPPSCSRGRSSSGLRLRHNYQITDGAIPHPTGRRSRPVRIMPMSGTVSYRPWSHCDRFSVNVTVPFTVPP